MQEQIDEPRQDRRQNNGRRSNKKRRSTDSLKTAACPKCKRAATNTIDNDMSIWKCSHCGYEC